MADGWMHTLILPLDPPLAVSYRNHQKSLAYFSHLAPSVLLFFTRRQSQKRKDTAQCPPLNTLLPRSMRLGACERIIKVLKMRLTRLQRSIWILWVMRARELEFIKQSPNDFYCSKVHDTHDVCCDNKDGGKAPQTLIW